MDIDGDTGSYICTDIDTDKGIDMDIDIDIDTDKARAVDADIGIGIRYWILGIRYQIFDNT